jgi:hypothetical protein
MKDENSKSQIRRIAEGLGAEQRHAPRRSQPRGQEPRMLKGNAAKLASVPSSSEEKFDGGRDAIETKKS